MWGVLVGLLALLGLGVENRLHRTEIAISGTESSRADAVTAARFGQHNDLVVMLRGPQPLLEQRGRQLTSELDKDTDLMVLAPWTAGASPALRPKRDAVLILVRANRPFEYVSRHVVPLVRGDVARIVRPPLVSAVSGFADLSEALHQANIDAAHNAEFIATPLLVLILFLVLRSPIATALPLVIGTTAFSAGDGILDLVNRVDPLDAFAVNMASVMGLALGIDYALVIVSRFREELAAGHEKVRAAEIAVETAGRTVLYAGAAVGLAMVGAYLVAPGNVLSSATVGVLAAGSLSLLGSLTALPAALSVLGPHVNRWSFGTRRRRSGRLAAIALRAIGRPATAALLVTALIGALAAPSLALQSGSPDPRSLPPDSPVRQDFTRLALTAGSGWTLPYQITVAAPRGAVTKRNTLRALAIWQHATAQRHDVKAVLGPAAIAAGARQLDSAPGQLDSIGPALNQGLRDQNELANGLSAAKNGSAALQGGLGEASSAARLLASGGAQGASGAERLNAGLARAILGANSLHSGSASALAGTGELSSGARQITSGARSLAGGIRQARARVEQGTPQVNALASGLSQGSGDLARLRQPGQLARSQLEAALGDLDSMLTTSKLDPAYRRLYTAVATAEGAISGRNPETGAPVAQGYSGLDAALAQASSQSQAAASGASQIAGGLNQLDGGLGQLASGADRLGQGGARLGGGLRQLDSGLSGLDQGDSALITGLTQLSGGTSALVNGIGHLKNGAQQLASGLASGSSKTGALTAGVDRMRAGVIGANGTLKGLGQGVGGTEQLVRTLGSGYFVLAALDSQSRSTRTSANFAVNLEHGGTAAQLLVVPNLGRKDVRALAPLRSYLEGSLRQLQQQTGLKAYIGGPAAVVQDFNSSTSGRYWLLALVLGAATLLALIVMLRSLVLPLVAVVLNLLTIGASFGVLTFFFKGNPPRLGGPGYLDAISIFMIFAVTFGLSIDYEVFMLSRMREGRELTGTTDGAIAYGLRHTAHVITGGALIMTGVFLASAISDVSSVREVGIALTFAVLLDSTAIRLLLLPALMRLLGDLCWWRPRWMTSLPSSRPSAPAAETLPTRSPTSAGIG